MVLNAPIMTLGEALRLYLELHLTGRPSYRTTQQVMRLHLAPWLDRDISTLCRKEFLSLKIAMKDKPAQFNNCLKAAKCAINYVLREGHCDGTNPLTLVRRYNRPSRARFCQPHEAPALIDSILQAPVKVRAFLLLIGCTSSRPIEVLRMRWSSLGMWTIGETTICVWDQGRTKNGTNNYKPIPSQVWKYLMELPRVSDWVFPGQDPSQHWAPCSYRKAWSKLRLFAGVPDLWVYDLRRTVGSWLSMHGENLQTVQHVLNHTSLQSTAVYARLNVQTVAGALQRHTDRLFEMSGKGVDQGECHAKMHTPTFSECGSLVGSLPAQAGAGASHARSAHRAQASGIE